MRRPGADLIAYYLNPDRLPVQDRWSRRHADTQRRLCERFAAPVVAAVICQDIKTEHSQKIVNAAPTAGEGDRVRRMISALVTAGLDGGYFTNPRLARVHWQAGDRALPAVQLSVAGESALWVGLRWGELTALTIPQIDQAARAITVDRKIVEVAGHLYLEAPKNRKNRRTIYPRETPGGYPLAARLAARIEEARAEQAADINPLGLMFPSPKSSGSSTPPTCPGWLGTPTIASHLTCTSEPPPESWTAHAQPPSSDRGRYEGPGRPRKLRAGRLLRAPSSRKQHVGG